MVKKVGGSAVKKSVKTVAAKRSKEEKKIFSVYLAKRDYEALKKIHGRETSALIGELIAAYLKEKGIKA